MHILYWTFFVKLGRMQATKHIKKYFKTVISVQHMKIFVPSHWVKTYVRKQDAKWETKKYTLWTKHIRISLAELNIYKRPATLGEVNTNASSIASEWQKQDWHSPPLYFHPSFNCALLLFSVFKQGLCGARGCAKIGCYMQLYLLADSHLLLYL